MSVRFLLDLVIEDENFWSFFEIPGLILFANGRCVNVGGNRHLQEACVFCAIVIFSTNRFLTKQSANLDRGPTKRSLNSGDAPHILLDFDL